VLAFADVGAPEYHSDHNALMHEVYSVA